MKTTCLIVGLLCFASSHAQVQELEQLKLDLEKLAQFKMMLSEMKAGYTTLTNGYNSIRDMGKSNFDLHQQFLDGLLEVNPSVKNDPGVKRIFDNQVQLVADYRGLVSKLLSSNVFTTAEINELSGKFSGIADIVSADGELLASVLSPGKLRMSDGERASVIGAIDQTVGKQVAKMKTISESYQQIMVLRLQGKRDMESLKRITGM